MTNTSIQAQSTSIGGVNPTPPPLVAILSPTALKLRYIRYVNLLLLFFFILATVSMGIQNLLQQVCTSKIILFYFSLLYFFSLSDSFFSLLTLFSLLLFFFSHSLSLSLSLSLDFLALDWRGCGSMVGLAIWVVVD